VKTKKQSNGWWVVIDQNNNAFIGINKQKDWNMLSIKMERMNRLYPYPRVFKKHSWRIKGKSIINARVLAYRLNGDCPRLIRVPVIPRLNIKARLKLMHCAEFRKLE